MKKILFVLILFAAGSIVNAQCNKDLLDKAKAMIEDNEVYINNFKVKLEKADINEPAPVAKFSHNFEASHKYVFRILNDQEEYNSVGIFRLFEDNTLLATNYVKKTNKAYKKLTFKCTKTGNYKILMTFQDGQAGCAVLIVSEVK